MRTGNSQRPGIGVGPGALLGLLLAVPLPPALRAQDAPPAPAWAEVAAVLQRRCVPCHGGERVKSGLRLATAATFAHGGSRGAVVDRQAPDRSRLLRAVRYVDPDLAMPPDGQLPADEVALLVAWVRAGAAWPEGPEGKLCDPERHFDEPARAGGALAADAADWWAYRPLRPVAVPVGASLPAHPVDALLHPGRAAAGLPVAAAAGADALLRRTTFALTGLPPSPERAVAFRRAHQADPAVALRALVDELLREPAHAEHFARHWLDLVRYADTNGYERDARKPNMWRYRDWVVRAFARDLPYDQFVLDQLAGDERGGDGAEPAAAQRVAEERLLATGYYRLGVWDDEPADREQARADELADIVDTTAQVFLATTAGCARCHDHKADPFSQRDYYALTAFFGNLRGYEGGRTVPLSDPPQDGRRTAAERAAAVAAVDAALAPIVAELRAAVGEAEAPVVLVADARAGAAEWRLQADAAPADWAMPGFDDSGWRSGRGGFGRAGTPGARIGTRWHDGEIHLRTRFALTALPRNLVLSLHHDDDVTVLLNGVEVLRRQGYRTSYTELQLDQAAVGALVVGANVLAVHCRQVGGGQYVDVGLRSGWLDEAEAWRQRLALEGGAVLPPLSFRRGSELLAERARLLAEPVAEAFPALVAAERGAEAPVQHVLLRGSAHAPGDAVAPAVPTVLRRGIGGDGALPAEPRERSTGRRLAFGRWLVDEGRFLTARVMANRVWQWLFGRGLCRSSGDFGRLGELPTHPELLDHLALVLIERGWSVRELIRHITASEAFRLASVGDAAALDRDPRNDRYWRFDPRRLRAEEYRDAVLALGGGLDRRVGGPSVLPPLPEAVLATSSKPQEAWPESPPADAARRSLYVLVKRSLRVPLLAALDQPDPDMPCPERFPTNVPTQALMTLNGAFAHEQAARIAARLRAARPDDLAGQITLGIELAFGRVPDQDEVARHAAFVGDGGDLALFALFLTNSSEFLWID